MWGTSPWSFGVDWCPQKSGIIAVPAIKSADATTCSKQFRSSSALTVDAEEDLMMRNLEMQALATLRELAIPTGTTSKRLSMEERMSTSSYFSSRSDQQDCSPLSPSSSSSLSCNSSENGDEYKSGSHTSVFIGRLPFDLTEKEFRSQLQSFSPLDSCICMNKRKKSKGFGFVSFETEQQAADFVEHAHDAFLFSKQKLPLRVEICRRDC
eukprot:TRINITY_DN2930_c0_g1_i1.p1 TRINITY_DN2930_c0_g1~~TRINITY_DN2930_c0_g1_i1.p1  ORF type:complete len:246 (-),score=42.66 TRINITY_DN2930_c0_g1_i1:251-880(-)